MTKLKTKLPTKKSNGIKPVVSGSLQYRGFVIKKLKDGYWNIYQSNIVMGVRRLRLMSLAVYPTMEDAKSSLDKLFGVARQ